MPKVVGIDLGTTNSCIAVQEGDNVIHLRTLRRVIQQGLGHLAHEVRYVRDVIAVTINSSRWGKIASGVLLAMA